MIFSDSKSDEEWEMGHFEIDDDFCSIPRPSESESDLDQDENENESGFVSVTFFLEFFIDCFKLYLYFTAFSRVLSKFS